jgi:carboxyl-terminal processing protease
LSKGFLAVLFVATAAAAAPPLSSREQGEDFDAMWRAIDTGYAYFERDRDAWGRANATWRARAMRANSSDDFISALEGAVAELRDDHVTLSEHSDDFPRRVPYETDIWAQFKDGTAIIEAVRTFSDADVAGLRPGHVITRLGGVPIESMVRERLGTRPATPAARDWVLRHALAGQREGSQRIVVRDGARLVSVEIERHDVASAGGPAIVGRRMGDERDIGYLRVRVGAIDEQFAEHFDGALNYLKDTRGLIVDLRENAAPGSREVTKAILSRFVATETPWQVREPRARPRVTDTVAPRGNAPYRAPVAVLVDRWTAGEGEVLAAGLKAVAHAQIIGTATAGLRGELREVKLPHSGIVMSYPAERAFQPGGEPREPLRPDLLIDLAAPSGGPGDPILYQALKVFEKR